METHYVQVMENAVSPFDLYKISNFNNSALTFYFQAFIFYPTVIFS